jgi:outer membrane lipoprotein carrier protein
MRPVGVCAAVACLAIATYAQAASSDTDALIQKVEHHYNKALTLTVDFAEQYSVQGHPHIPETGTLTLRKQGKMRWDYARPAGKIFISDGKMMYLYTSADNKVEEIPLKDTEDMRAPLAFLLGHLDLKKEFTNFATRPAEGQTWLSATAKNDKTPYEKIQMLINPAGEITTLTILGRDQSTLAFSLTNEKVNPAVSDSLFAFKIPAGAEVVNAIDYTGEGR